VTELAPPVLFVHVMKTGGTTLINRLRDHYGPAELWPDPAIDHQFDGPRLVLRHHLSRAYLASLPDDRRRQIRVYVGHLPLVARESIGPEVATMTILRHPVDRTISLLRQFRRPVPWWHDRAKVARLADASLEEVYESPRIFGPLVLNHQTKIFSMRADDAADSYLDEVPVDAGRLQEAKANLETVDVVGLTERYADFLEDVAARFGWRVDAAARDNATPDHDQSPVDPDLVRRIEADNALDMQLYEHARELVALRRGRTSLA
jgi:hypothetical protein